VERDGKPINLTVTIGSLDDAVRRIAASLEDRLGVVVRPLKADESRNMGWNRARGLPSNPLTPTACWEKPVLKKTM
jgi:serine protease Do